MIKLPEKCLRKRNDCNPYAQIESDDHESLICCGVHDGTMSKILQDKYTLCFKNDDVDSITLNDKRDLTHLASVILQALSIIEELEENSF